MEHNPFEVMYAENVLPGTVELFHLAEGMVLYFHDQADHKRWLNGKGFRLINHWTREVNPLKYDVAEKIRKK